MKTFFGFRQFLEDMDPSFEKKVDSSMNGNKANKDDSQQLDYFAALGDEQGISWEDLVKSLEGQPWVSSHFDLGGIKYKLSAWEIVPGSLNQNGADIRLKPQNNDRSYLKGNRLNKSSYRDDKRYHLSRKQLIDFLTTGWTPAVQAAQSSIGADPSMGQM
ncbi:MAG: hypothetical protein EKK64_10355 [Neisseriaceae bacterium]|nr:MAG: hypothetical protein EKK64_10355 [Neisseriaceae bacterium]